MNDSLFVKKLPVPPNAKHKVYHDTIEIVQNTSAYNFFPATSTRNLLRDNYFSNSLPGNDSRLVLGLSFELVQQHIENDSANSIDGENIINALAYAGLRITADNDNKEYVRDRLSRYFNFRDIELAYSIAAASDGATAPAINVAEQKIITVQGTEVMPVPDPFRIASNQTFDIEVTFADSSVFPTSQNWEDASQPALLMRCNLHVAEIKSN